MRYEKLSLKRNFSFLPTRFLISCYYSTVMHFIKFLLNALFEFVGRFSKEMRQLVSCFQHMKSTRDWVTNALITVVYGGMLLFMMILILAVELLLMIDATLIKDPLFIVFNCEFYFYKTVLYISLEIPFRLNLEAESPTSILYIINFCKFRFFRQFNAR